MRNRSWKIFIAIACMVSVILAFFDWRWLTGWLLGCFEAFIQYKRTESYWNGIMSTGVSHPGTGYGHFLFNYGIMAGTLLACAFLPQYLNILSCAAGMLMIKITSVVEVLVYKEREQL